jgi:hypothetical protein
VRIIFSLLLLATGALLLGAATNTILLHMGFSDTEALNVSAGVGGGIAMVVISHWLLTWSDFEDDSDSSN